MYSYSFKGVFSMRKTVIKIISLVMIFTLSVLSSSICTQGYETYFYNSFSNYDDVSLVRNSEQIYLIGISGKSVELEAVYPNEYNISLSLEQNVHDYTLCSDMLILVSYLDDINTKITLYDITNDHFDSFLIQSDSKYILSSFAYSNGGVYIATPDGTIRCYSKYGKHYKDYYLNTNRCSLTTDFYGNVYALTNSGMYSISQNNYSKISSTRFSSRGCFVSDDIFVDEIGNFYRLNNYGKLLDHSCYSIYPCGGVYSKHLITFQDNKIYAINNNNGQKELSCSLMDDIQQLYSIGKEIVVLTYSEGAPSISFISFDELKKIPSKNTQQYNQYNSNGDFTSSISSSVYNVDFDDMKITDIPNGTTVAQFKNNMEYDGYSVEFYRYEKDTPLKSGNVGTATQAIFYNNDERYVFELSVIGDLTGEGNVNSRDKKLLFYEVVERIHMTGVFIDSADLDESNEIDVVDVILLMRMIKAQQQS